MEAEGPLGMQGVGCKRAHTRTHVHTDALAMLPVHLLPCGLSTSVKCNRWLGDEW